MQRPASSSRSTRLGDSPDADADGGRLSSSSRVCDNCIRQKVKCDLGRPRCTRCTDRGITCVYSSTRRKPGPSPGFRRGSRRGQATPNRQQVSAPPQIVHDDEALWQEDASDPEPLSQTSNASPSLSFHPTPSDGEHQSVPLNVLPEEEDYLLSKYFETIHYAIPLFSKTQLPPSNSTDSKDLISTLLAITAKLSNFTFSQHGFDLDAFIDRTLSSVHLQEDMCADSPTLDQFRKFCLLAFYQFHQFPGHQAWMRIGKLVRMGYWIGLDRLDVLRMSSRDWSTASDDDIEDWRLVWWCLYRLDSYANLAVGTPYQVNEQVINTALLADQLMSSPDGSSNASLSLPSRHEDLLHTIAAVTALPHQQNHDKMLFNLHIVTEAALRRVWRMIQRHSIVDKDNLPEALAATDRDLSALRLALPRNFFNPSRNVFDNESSTNHHARLVAGLHLMLAQLLTYLVDCRWKHAAGAGGTDNTEWLLSWQRVLEGCQNIAKLINQWDSAYSLNIDPAVCLIFFTTLVFLDLHRKFDGMAGNVALHMDIEHCQTMLLLQLEQLAGTWTLPRLVILSFKGFQESLTGPFSYRQINLVLSRFEAPLHPRWLKFLSTAHLDLNG